MKASEIAGSCFLQPSDCMFAHSPGGVLTAVITGRNYAEVTLKRCFPYACPDRYISVRTQSGDEIGVIERLDQLADSSRLAAERELVCSYMTPIVRQIHRIRRTKSRWLWEVTTNEGEWRMWLDNLHEHIAQPAPGKLLITDDAGMRYIIDTDSLDKKSRKLLRTIY